MEETQTASLYAHRLLDKARSEKFQSPLKVISHTAFMKNPLCGDQIQLNLYCDDGKLTQIQHETKGCLICLASAAVMAEQCMGKDKAELEAEYTLFKNIIHTGHVPVKGELYSDFAALHQYKARLRCAELPWLALIKSMGIFKE